jgi:hypothetical protein
MLVGTTYGNMLTHTIVPSLLPLLLLTDWSAVQQDACSGVTKLVHLQGHYPYSRG